MLPYPVATMEDPSENETSGITHSAWIELNDTIKWRNMEIEQLKSTQKELEMKNKEEIEVLLNRQKNLEEAAGMAKEWKKAFETKNEQLKNSLDIIESFKEENERCLGIRKKLEDVLKKSVSLENEMKDMQKEIEKKEGLKEKLNVFSMEIKKLKEENEKLMEALERSVSQKFADELESQLKTSQEEKAKQSAENQKLKKNFSEEIKKKDEEIKNWGRRNTELAELKNQEISKMRNEHFRINLSKSEEIEELKNRINGKEEAEEEMRRKIQSLTSQVQHWKVKRTETINLTLRIHQLEKELAEKNELLKKLQNKISRVRTFLDPGSSTVLPESTVERLQRSLNTLDIDSCLKLALEMKERLISLSDRSEIHQMAIYEYQQYERKLRNYQQELEKNIQILKRSKDVACLISLPEFPSFSDRFIKEYWLEIDRKAGNAPKKSDCVVCFEEMHQEDRNLTRCQHCQTNFHAKCLSDWIRINPSCPHCRQQLQAI